LLLSRNNAKNNEYINQYNRIATPELQIHNSKQLNYKFVCMSGNKLKKEIMNKNIFRSRISILVILFMLEIFFLPIIPIISEVSFIELLVLILVLSLIFVFSIYSFFKISYEINNGKLYGKMWSISTGYINISEIISIKRTYNPLSSAAASLNRLCVKIKKKGKYPYILISPIRENEFIENLLSINPDIKIDVSYKKRWWKIWNWDI